MSYRIVLTPIAKINIDQATAYYKTEVSVSVAKLFIEDYRKSFKTIVINPYFKIYFNNFRGLPLKKFPYILFYTIDENLKIITLKALFHTSQNPTKYPKR